jgi:hypothetical protein
MNYIKKTIRCQLRKSSSDLKQQQVMVSPALTILGYYENTVPVE